MCGIIGIIGKENTVPRITQGLRRLEYRGYDSAGIATINDDGMLTRRRASGKLSALDEVLKQKPLKGKTGIGHTRWATHGRANTQNAHPHVSESDALNLRVAVVHNGIIENYAALKSQLESAGQIFASETDSEVVAHLLIHELEKTDNIQIAAQKTFAALAGTYALALILSGVSHGDGIVLAARHGSPLAIGLGDGETYLGSDGFALAPFSNQLIYLDDGDWAILRHDGAAIYDEQGQSKSPAPVTIDVAASMVDKGGYRHFMAKEIHEQADVLSRCLKQYLAQYLESLDTQANHLITLPPNMPPLDSFTRVVLIGCGTAYFAAQIGARWIESIAGVSAQADIASEFRYRDAPLPSDCLAIFISQSGETADTLAALQHCRDAGMTSIAIVNTPESSMTRNADVVLPSYAGPEIGVASTKALTAQLAVLASLTIAFATQNKRISTTAAVKLCDQLRSAPRLLNQVFKSEDDIAALAHDIHHCTSALFIGRGTMFPLALEGALKLKEISYIHAEGFAAGELKHGSIALIDETMPVIVLAPDTHVRDKTLSNMQETLARGAQVILIGSKQSINRAQKHTSQKNIQTIAMPDCDPFIAPLIYILPLHMLAYHAACAKGTDVDQPRNLAKSVTVE